MMIPEACYRLTDLDLSGTLAEFVSLKNTVTGAAAALAGSFYVIPVGKLLVVQSIVSTLTPGAAQTARYHAIYMVINGKLINLASRAVDPAVAAAIGIAETMRIASGGLIIPFGYALQHVSEFNAGVAVNSMTVDLTGWLIPRGSVVI